MNLEELGKEIICLIAFYELRGWDWRNAVEFTIRRANGSLP